MSKEIVIATPTAFELEPEAMPILPNWVLSGTPISRVKNVVRSRDWTSHVVVWECTRGEFRWRYRQDEVVVIVSGEVFITTDEGQERRLGPGDLAFFPAGSSSIWRVPGPARRRSFFNPFRPNPSGHHMVSRITATFRTRPAKDAWDLRRCN